MRDTVIVLILMIVSAALVGCGRDDTEPIPYDPDFIELVKTDKVSNVSLMREPSGVLHITGWTKPDSSPGKQFRVEVLDPKNSVVELLTKNGVGFAVQAPSRNQDDGGALAMWPMLVPVVWGIIMLGVIIFALLLALRFVRAVERIADKLDK